MGSSGGLISGFHIEASGETRLVGISELLPGAREGWVVGEFDRQNPQAQAWLHEASGLTPQSAHALLEADARPRCSPTNRGVLLILRAINLGPGEDPEDMVTARIWAEQHRVFVTRQREIEALSEIREQLVEGEGPEGPGDFIIRLADGMAEAVADLLERIDDGLDDLERDAVAEHDSAAIRERLGDLRHLIIPLRRYLAPQRNALGELAVVKAPWLDESQRAELRELTNRYTRYVEDLDAAGQRAAVIHDTIATHLSESMNRIMLLLSVVAAVFLPLTLLTGLLGINVAGIPGAGHPWAFWLVVGLIVLLGGLEVWIIRKLGLM